MLEMIELVKKGEVADAAGLRSVLSQIALAPIQRMDDWSVLLVDMQQPVPPQEPVEPVSMLREEEAKYPSAAKKPYRYRVRDCHAREMTWAAYDKAYGGLADADIETMALELSRQIEQEHLRGSDCVDVRPERVRVTVRRASADGACGYAFRLGSERRKKNRTGGGARMGCLCTQRAALSGRRRGEGVCGGGALPADPACKRPAADILAGSAPCRLQGSRAAAHRRRAPAVPVCAGAW